MSAVASSGVVAEQMLGRPCEDTITLTAEWENIEDGSRGHAVYTASWTAAKASCIEMIFKIHPWDFPSHGRL